MYAVGNRAGKFGNGVREGEMGKLSSGDRKSSNWLTSVDLRAEMSKKMTESSSKGSDNSDAEDDRDDTVNIDIASDKSQDSVRHANEICIGIQYRGIGNHGQ